jgi:hypothetical protein
MKMEDSRPHSEHGESLKSGGDVFLLHCHIVTLFVRSFNAIQWVGFPSYKVRGKNAVKHVVSNIFM